MSTADQLLSAKIAAVARRYTRQGVIEDLDSAVAELRAVAGDRPDLLAEHAGLALGTAEVVDDTLAPQYRAEAALCVLQGPTRRSSDPGSGRPPARRGSETEPVQRRPVASGLYSGLAGRLSG
jgi:hypothetical protein